MGHGFISVPRKSSHVPYRDSRLTRLLQESPGTAGVVGGVVVGVVVGCSIGCWSDTLASELRLSRGGAQIALKHCFTASAVPETGFSRMPRAGALCNLLTQDSLGGNTKTVMVANVGCGAWNRIANLSSINVCG